MKALGATLREVDIKAAVRTHFADIGQDENVHDVTYENCQGQRADAGAYGYCQSAGRPCSRYRGYV